MKKSMTIAFICIENGAVSMNARREILFFFHLRADESDLAARKGRWKAKLFAFSLFTHPSLGRRFNNKR